MVVFNGLPFLFSLLLLTVIVSSYSIHALPHQVPFQDSTAHIGFQATAQRAANIPTLVLPRLMEFSW